MITVLIVVGALAASAVAATVAGLARDGYRAVPARDAGRPGTWAQAPCPTDSNASS
jgi:hypothetical protein